MDIEKEIEDISKGMAFAAGFAKALLKLRAAKDRGTGCELDAHEVESVMEAFRLLKMQG